MRGGLIAVALTAAASLLPVAAAAQTVPGPEPVPVPAGTVVDDAVQRQATALRDRFMAAVRACGITPPFDPSIIVDSHPSIIAYSFEARTAHLSRWAELPAPLQAMLEAWGADGPLGLSGEQQFADIFNSLLVPHELGHYLQHVSGRYRTLDLWEGEVEANRIAIAFWSLDPAEAARLPDRIENFAGFLGKIPSPVPEGSQPRDYFNANYEALGQDAEAYGWYQGAFMRTAWEERDQTDFCDLVTLNAPG